MNVSMNSSADGAAMREFMFENAIFVAFLTLNLFFRRVDPELASAAIVFSPFHATYLTAISLHGDRPERRQNTTDRYKGDIGTDPFPRSLSSAPQIPASPDFYAPPSSGLHTLWATESPACGWPESRSSAPF